MWSLAGGAPDTGQFIDSFCDTSLIPDHFKGQLGRFTPCFTDIVVLGSAHLTAACLCAARLAQLLRRRSPQFRLLGASRAAHAAAAALSGGCLLVVLFQLNARLAADPTPLVSGRAAPFEWASYSLGLLSWALFLAIFLLELAGRYSPVATFLWRFPVFLVLAGQVAKLWFVVELSSDAAGRTYFYYLFLLYVGLQGALAALAAFHFPPPEHLEPSMPLGEGYAPLPRAELAARGDGETCPEATAGILSHLTFSWMGGLMVRGYRAPLRFEDVWKLPPGDRVKALGARFEKEWSSEQEEAAAQKKEPSLVAACWRCTSSLFLTALPWKLVSDAATFSGPVFLRLLLSAVASGDAGSSGRGYSYAGAMLAGLLTGVVADNQQFQRVMRAGFQLRSMLTHAVYQKVLSMAPTARAKFTSGRLYSAVGADVDSIQQLCMSLLGVVSAPIRIIGALYLLHAQLGAAAWVTLGLLAALMPLQAWMMRVSAGVTRANMAHTDERSKLESELVAGVDVVKCYAWEESFMSRVLGVRALELKGLWKVAVISGINTTVILGVPVLAALGSFGAYSLLSSEPLTAAQAFTSLTLLGVLQVPLFQMPMLVSGLVAARVAMGRLQAILASEEQPPLGALPPAAPGEAAVKVEGEFSWDESSPPALVDMKFQAPAGALVAVVGPTGSGKSSLLSAALGLMHQLDGPSPQLRGAAAYVAQAAFIVADTVRANILFGEVYEEERYWRAVRAACLEQDLQQLPAGDLTELGDRGVNVSGGQKQRVALARATYCAADVVLLDDPLSALDAKVGRRVFRECILGEMAGRTRVLVTNQLQYARSADLVAFMQDGRIAEFGRYDELMAAGGGFAAAMAQAVVEEEEEEEGEEDQPSTGDKDQPSTPDEGPQKGGAGGPGGGEGAAPPAPTAGPLPAPAAPAGGPSASSAAAAGRLTADEGVSQGAVSAAVIWAYVAAMGGLLAALGVIGGLTAVEGARVGSQLWLQKWTADVDASGGATAHPALWYMGIYASIAGCQVLFTLSSQFFFKGRALAAADRLHAGMLARLLRAPMSFFNVTPLGRIVNRLTKDTSDVDRMLPDFTAFYLRSVLQLCSTLALVAALNPFTMWALTPCLLGFYLLYQYFQATVREVKRLDAVSRSPLYSSVGEAVGGLPTIRAFRAERRLVGRAEELLDRNIVMSLVNQSANRWLSIRLEGLGACAAFAAAALAVEQRGAAALVGNILSSALQLTPLVAMTVRAASLAELSFNAVERIDEYCRAPQEAAAVVPGSTPEGWPSKGEIKFDAVRMRYRPGLPLVLKGLSFTIPGGSSAGVVGRTGAGKSSLISALFRLAEPEGGAVLLDGLDTQRVGLTQLRSAMALIPQSPVLFTGTIRFNLSPFGEFSDGELWAALRRAHLAPAIQATQLGLDMVISEGGAPLSAGQKQLLALARALLKKARVLVLDEATASVDLETDALIQKTVRAEFQGCTVLAVAHRLHTIIDADSVLVMDAGRAAEFGPPAELLNRPGGNFADMVRETGEATERLLRQLAAGEAQAQGSWDAAAQHALERLLSAPREAGAGLLPGECAYRLSKEVEAAAAGAAAAVRAALDAMRESEEAAAEGDSLPGEDAAGPGPVCAVAASLRHAFLLVEQVRQLAEQAQRHAPRPMGCDEEHLGRGGGGGSGASALSPRGLLARTSLDGSGAGADDPDLSSALSWPVAAGGTGGAAEERAPVLSVQRSAGSGSARQLGRRPSGLGAVAQALGSLSGSRRRLLREDPSIQNNPSLQ